MKLVDDLERALPDTIWWCETGQHFDLVHRQSALDLCSTCGQGVCVLKPTTLSGKPRRKRKYKGPLDSPIVTNKEVAAAPLPDGFALNEEQLAQLREGRRPGIAFPKSLEAQLSVGARYEIEGQLHIVITGLDEEKLSFALYYEVIRDGDSVLTERFNPHAEAVPKTHRRAEINKAGEQTVKAESEPEPITTGDVQRMTDDNRTRRIEDLRASIKDLEEVLHGLEERHPGKSRYFWPLNENIKRISKDLATEENIARDLPPVSSETVA